MPTTTPTAEKNEKIDVTVTDSDAAPVVKIANEMLATVVNDKASDVHLECYEDTLKIFKDALDEPQGMILVTGPTGSGKTRTLYGALAELTKPQYKIFTVEDPIEFELAGSTRSR